MKKILRLLGFLGMISALAGLSLGFVNGLVEPVIAENSRKAEEISLHAIFPDTQFQTIPYSDPDGIVEAVFHAEGKGYVVKTHAIGFNSSTEIVLLIGFDEDGNTVAMKPLQQQETNGFGSRNFQEENIEKLYLHKSMGDDIELLSGATFTSKAIRTMFEAARAAVKEMP